MRAADRDSFLPTKLKPQFYVIHVLVSVDSNALQAVFEDLKEIDI